ncbi:hypothetical protein CGLO_14820 [Colletotrichum gloeosporioides Cg-14]|uniref:Uncharacterized protein n=1 Tax=Colletotrichum gloeosporioides (strain Cg-14) TaxID=1237896 RepID=T0LCW2_COLGC|nr:hypothetical protein CGLO_14820 [Colletotrichum gloeosporioides Cg-14]
MILVVVAYRFPPLVLT